MIIHLYDFHPRIWCQKLENLPDIDFGRAVRKATVAEHGTERLSTGDGFHHAVRNIFIKAGDQVAVVIGVYSAAIDLFRCIRERERQSPLQQTAEEQIKVRAVSLMLDSIISRRFCS